MLIDDNDRLPQEDSKNDNVPIPPTHIPSATPQAQQPTSVELHPVPKETSTITKEETEDKIVPQDQTPVEANQSLPTDSQDPQQGSHADIIPPSKLNDHKTSNDISNSNQHVQPQLDHPNDEQPVHKNISTPQVHSEAPESVVKDVDHDHANHDTKTSSGKIAPIDHTIYIL